MGIALAVLLGVGMEFGSGIFTKDQEVIKLIHKGLPVNPSSFKLWFKEYDCNSNIITVCCDFLYHSIKKQKIFLKLEFWSSVCSCNSTYKLVGFCFWWCQLWSIWLHLLRVFNGMLNLFTELCPSYEIILFYFFI